MKKVLHTVDQIKSMGSKDLLKVAAQLEIRGRHKLNKSQLEEAVLGAVPEEGAYLEVFPLRNGGIMSNQIGMENVEKVEEQFMNNQTEENINAEMKAQDEDAKFVENKLGDEPEPQTAILRGTKVANAETQAKVEVHVDKQKSRKEFIMGARVGSIVAFTTDSSNSHEKILLSAKVTAKLPGDMFELQTLHATTYEVPWTEIVWVKDGPRWPKWVYNMFKNKSVKSK